MFRRSYFCWSIPSFSWKTLGKDEKKIAEKNRYNDIWIYWNGLYSLRKKQQRGIAFLSGFALVAYPYFFPNVVLVILIGIVFMALLFVIKF